jgi:hypothetical protein
MVAARNRFFHWFPQGGREADWPRHHQVLYERDAARAGISKTNWCDGKSWIIPMIPGEPAKNLSEAGCGTDELLVPVLSLICAH